MKRRFFKAAAAALAAACLLCACAGKEDAAPFGAPSSAPASSALAPDTRGQGVSFTDALGNTVELQSWERVVSLYGSFAEAWSLAGGTLVGVTEDAVSERGMDLSEDVRMLGGNRNPSLESILACDPDFLILSADVSEQVKLDGALTQARVPHAYFRVDTFEDYLRMMELFCGMTGRSDLYEQNAGAVAEKIEQVKQAVQGQEQPTVLYLRAFSTGVKAKAEDNQTGVMLAELGADNIAARHPSLLEELSMEEVIAEDPDFILMTVMGADEQAGLDYMREHVENNPAWAGLSAVQNGRYLLLPKPLFHYKPNARWGESYAYLARILYPQLAAEIDAR